MSMFDRQGIPEYLLREDTDVLQFGDALAALISYSLIHLEIEGKFFNMHRLVQLSTRIWLETQQELSLWQEKSQAIMARVFPDGGYGSWIRCQVLLPHAKEVMKPRIYGSDEDLLNRATISSKCGLYLYLQGAYKEAEEMHRWAMEAQEKVLGVGHPSTLTSLSYFGHVLSSQGKYDEAEVMYQRVVEAREKTLGAEHPDTLTSVSHIGHVLNGQGKYKEAEAMHRRALEGYEKLLGPEHPDTLTCVNNLGLVLSHQRKYEEAEAMHQRLQTHMRGRLDMATPSRLLMSTAWA